MRAADNECDIQCNLMWDGFGRWVTGFKWKPYMDFTREGNCYFVPGKESEAKSKATIWATSIP